MKFVDLAKHKFVIEPRYYFYGWSFMVVLIGLIAGVTAPVTWDIWQAWITRGTSAPVQPDTLDTKGHQHC